MAAPATSPMRISVVIPVWHDSAALRQTLQMPRQPGDEWIVVNGDPADATLDDLRRAHRDVSWLDGAKGRGVQVAVGAASATGDWVLVLHADTRLAAGWRDEVTGAAAAASYEWGCFRLRLDASAWQARLIEAAVRARVRVFRLPYGDQAMFFRRSTLERLGGVPAVPLMEDVALARRFARTGPLFRSPLPATTSARRWERDGWWRRTLRNWLLVTRYLLGESPDRLATAYAPEGVPQGGSTTGTTRC